MITFKQRVQRRNLWFTQTNQKRTLLGEHTVGFHIPFNHVQPSHQSRPDRFQV